MKKLSTTALIASLLIASFSACQPSGEGPNAWIDQPLDDETFPLQSLTLQAHASDSDGVGTIEFSVNDQILKTINAGGTRFGQAAMEWMPSAPGVYTIYAKATDNAGNAGAVASSTITIIDQVVLVPPIEPEQPIIEPEKVTEEEPEEEIQLAEEPEPLPGPVAIPNQTINCRSGPGTDYKVLAALSSTQQALIIGRLSDNTWYVVTHPDKQIECWVAANIVQLKGSLDGVSIRQPPALPVKPPEEEPPAPPEPEIDTKPPKIASVSLSPGTIYQQGCGGFTQTAVLTVDVIDLGGVAAVEAAWTGGSIKLTHIGGYSYQATIGPISTLGSVLIYGSAVDNAGNWSPFSATLTVVCCVC
ncbi:MAG: Ig-like domain-containing protein [Anaerolineaceae bacterium]|nr:Ig-like domain-containing protein [Anaerolineaceae bacterium]